MKIEAVQLQLPLPVQDASHVEENGPPSSFRVQCDWIPKLYYFVIVLEATLGFSMNVVECFFECRCMLHVCASLSFIMFPPPNHLTNLNNLPCSMHARIVGHTMSKLSRHLVLFFLKYRFSFT